MPNAICGYSVESDSNEEVARTDLPRVGIIGESACNPKRALLYIAWNAKAICWAIRGQPQLGLRCFISTTA